MITAIAGWLGGKLLTSTGIVPKSGILIVAGVLAAVSLMIGALGTLAFVNHGLRSELRNAVKAAAQCSVHLRTSQANVGVLEFQLQQQNVTVEALAKDCTKADEKASGAALQTLEAPAVPRRFPEGAQGMNEWLATK